MSDIHKPEDFEKLYQSGGWDGQGSGPGSSESFTTGFRAVFENLLAELKIKSVFDLGCGDWQWQRHVNCWPEGLSYIGWDVSETAIRNIPRFIANKDSTYRMLVKDAFIEPIWPEADLLLVKDVVHHISPFRVRMLNERARLYSYVLWVLDCESESPGIAMPCDWHGERAEWDHIYEFDISPPYGYGRKAAFLQINP